MERLATGYIYRLYSDKDDRFYIGSTNNIKLREGSHKSRPISKKVNKWFSEVGVDNIKYTIVSEYENIYKTKLKMNENKEILKYLKKDPNCQNQRRVIVTKEERQELNRQYRSDNYETIRRREMEYKKTHKEEVNAKSRNYNQTHKESIEANRQKNRENIRLRQKVQDARRYKENKHIRKSKIECPLCRRTVCMSSFNAHQKSEFCFTMTLQRLADQS